MHDASEPVESIEKPPRLVWLLAGEASGDVIGARLMLALHRKDPGLVFAGVGGNRMEALGLRSLFSMQDLSVMGFWEVLPRLRGLRQRLREAVQDIELRRPDMVVTIDSPGFSTRLMREVAHLNTRRVQYVAPQVWAWKRKRVEKYVGLWDKLLCLFPFEPEWFTHKGIRASFVGHPVLESGVRTGVAQRFHFRHFISPGEKILLLMPGSRAGEVRQLLPLLGGMLDHLREAHPNLRPVIPVGAYLMPLVRSLTKRWKTPPLLINEIEDKHDAFASASCAVTKSGTSTLELAMGGLPMVVAHRVNPVSAFITRRLIKVPYVAMVNLLAGRCVVPELLQGDATPENLASAISLLLSDETQCQLQRDSFQKILAVLKYGEKTPSEAAADEILDLLSQPLALSDSVSEIREEEIPPVHRPAG